MTTVTTTTTTEMIGLSVYKRSFVVIIIVMKPRLGNPI